MSMHGITNIITHLAPPSPGAAGAPSPAQSNNGFQTALSARAAFNPPSAQGVSASVSNSLAAQTASLLLQTQEITQTQVHGGGGGGHHGGMKTMPGLEVEEAGESEEAQQLRQRKKMTATNTPSDISETAEVDENGAVVTDDIEQEQPQQKEDALNFGPRAG